MSKRIWIGLIGCLAAASALADAQAPGMAPQTSMRLGDTGWHLYRPDPRTPRIYDLDYMMDHLRCDLQSYGLRFNSSRHFSLDLTIAPLSHRRDFVGAVYDMDIGATRLLLTFRF